MSTLYQIPFGVYLWLDPNEVASIYWDVRAKEVYRLFIEMKGGTVLLAQAYYYTPEAFRQLEADKELLAREINALRTPSP